MLEKTFIIAQPIKEFSVSEISNRIKDLLESNLGYVRVKGEISGLKVASSGHGYFNLKDNIAVLAITCWRPVLAKIKFPLVDGIEVSITGKLTSYPGGSRYQLSAEKVEPAGIGAWMQILNERRERLEKEGLFSKSSKKPLPFLPTRIGVITSITGSVIKDIIHRIIDRFPSHVIIWPVTVQGENAASEIVEAIEGFNKLDTQKKPDVIIVARGGGSIEDLWPFNEEIVVRSVANSSIPIISAVGHETDYTLIDLASDVRAPTPTAAAEFSLPVASSLKYTISSYYNRALNHIMQLLVYKQQTINSYDRILRYPINYIESNRQRLDELGFRLIESLPNLLKFKATDLQRFNLERLTPIKIVNYKSLQLAHQNNYINQLIEKNLSDFENRLTLNSTLLASLDYSNVLKRGFALVKTSDGKFLSSKADTRLNDNLSIKFFDGELLVKKL